MRNAISLTTMVGSVSVVSIGKTRLPMTNADEKNSKPTTEHDGKKNMAGSKYALAQLFAHVGKHCDPNRTLACKKCEAILTIIRRYAELADIDEIYNV
jgi:hypothetical protein